MYPYSCNIGIVSEEIPIGFRSFCFSQKVKRSKPHLPNYQTLRCHMISDTFSALANSNTVSQRSQGLSGDRCSADSTKKKTFTDDDLQRGLRAVKPVHVPQQVGPWLWDMSSMGWALDPQHQCHCETTEWSQETKSETVTKNSTISVGTHG